MLERIKSWFRTKPVVPQTPTPPARPTLDEIANSDEFKALFNEPRSGKVGGPLIKGVGRDYNDTLHACHMRGCVRPSAFTVMAAINLDVDIPFSSPSRLRTVNWSKEPLTPYDAPGTLPIYRQYMLCDRHYASHVRGKDNVAYVFGPDHVYDPDTHEETQAKLAKALKV